jgi:hypothetical protein
MPAPPIRDRKLNHDTLAMARVFQQTAKRVCRVAPELSLPRFALSRYHSLTRSPVATAAGELGEVRTRCNAGSRMTSAGFRNRRDNKSAAIGTGIKTNTEQFFVRYGNGEAESS